MFAIVGAALALEDMSVLGLRLHGLCSNLRNPYHTDCSRNTSLQQAMQP